MIKSNNIDNNTLFYNDDSLFTSKMSQYGIRAYCQKNIIKRLILKEDFDVESELRSLLSAQGAKFDTYIQENEEIYNYTNKISYYNEYIQRLLANKDIITTDDLTETDYVELNSKKYQPVFDFLYEDVRGIHIGKIKTSKFKNPLINNRDKNDMYILSLWAKRVYPNKPIFINFDYLIESKVSGDLPYERRRNQIEEEVTDELMEKLKESYEQQLETGCSPANCGSCDRNQLCNYEEPPINLGTERVIKPLSEIRLTQAQREVKDNEEGISRVIAGAGAGKTLVVAMRVVELIRKGYDPKKIAMLTYTTTGAKEMTDRVIRYLAGQEGILVDPTLITSGTINSFGQNILNEHFEELGYTAPPKVIPEEVRSGIVNDILNTYAQIPEWKYRSLIKGPNAKFANMYTALNQAKLAFSSIKKNKWDIFNNGFSGKYSDQSIQMIFLMYQNYEMQMKQRNLIDFDDQLDLVLKLIETHPNLFDEYGFEHIITDEFQDSNLKQIEILKAMIDANCFKSYMAVGDDSQSIFSFQDASPEFIINFQNYFGEFKDYQLIENHRSSRNIVNNANAINALVEDKVEKDLIATQIDGENVEVQGYYTQLAEYRAIANDIKTRIEQGEDPSSIAILACTGDELRAMASSLSELNIPSVLMNPVPYKKNCRVVALCDFYDSFFKGTSKGLIEYENVLVHGTLKTASKEELNELVENKKDEIKDIPKTYKKFIELAEKLDENKQDICYQDFLDRISYCNTLEDLDEFFVDFELYGDDSTCSKTKEGCYDGVNLITIHSSKGLEWDTTYLLLDKFDNKNFHKSPNKYNDEINEKRRLWFVGATRAKKKLICSGKYLLETSNKDGIMFNTFLRDAYKIQDKAYDYNSMKYYQIRADELEKRERENEYER